MLTFSNPTIAPPGLFQYVAEGGQDFREATLDELESRVVSYLRDNKIPVPTDIRQVLIDAQCARVPSLCFDRSVGFVVGFGQINWKEAESFAQTILKAALGGVQGESPFVSQSEAERRAAICVNCPLNVGFSSCASCDTKEKIAEWVQSFAGRKTTQDQALNGCAACGCVLRLKVHARRDLLSHTPLHRPFHAGCWMLTEEVNRDDA